LVAQILSATGGCAQDATPVALNLEEAQPDPTVTGLEKAKLREEVNLLRRSDDQNLHDWLGANVNGLVASIGTIVVGLFAVYRYFKDREDAREKRAEEDRDQLASQAAERVQRAEERFHRVVQGLGADQLSARIGAAVTLRSFLQQEDKQFYSQVFDLAAAHLRFVTGDENTILRQELATVFRDAYPLARGQVEFEPDDAERSYDDAIALQISYERLDGSSANMQGTSNWGADYRYGSLKNANFEQASITEADFSGGDLRGANFSFCPGSRSKFIRCFAPSIGFEYADLSNSSFFESRIFQSSFNNDTLVNADLRRVEFNTGIRLELGSGLSGANLRNADLSGANLTGANLTATNIEQAESLQGTILRGVRGLSAEQVEICREKGAIEIEVVEEADESIPEPPDWLFEPVATPPDDSIA
jgi:uncharacterized protein YjbI with pentapeptide repeats